MSTSSRYSSKAHLRENRTALFSTTQQQAQLNNNNGSNDNLQYNNNPLSQPGSSTSLNGYSTPEPQYGKPQEDQYLRSSSPYDDPKKNRKDFTASMMSQLESQNEEEFGMMSEKIGMLKNLGLGLGDQIKKSQANLNVFGNDMDSTRNRLKGTFNRMMVMAEKSGISWKTWTIFFFFVFFLFFWVWIF